MSLPNVQRHANRSTRQARMATFLSAPFGPDFPATADVLIVGGGPAGAAALWALARFDPTLRVVLIEQQEALGAGSTLASLECFRSCWPAECLARQVGRSIEVFRHADEYLGEGAAGELSIKQNGYLFCAFTEAQAATLRADVTHLHEIGLAHIEYLEVDEVRQRFGWVGSTVIAAKFDPLAGWLDSHALIYRFARSAVNARILLGMNDIALRIEGGRVLGISTAHGNIDAPRVLLAAGANSMTVAKRAGLTLPVVLRPRQSFTTAWRDPAIPPTSPMIISAAPHPHLHPEAREGAIFGFEYAWNSKYAGPTHASNRRRDALLDPYTPLERLKDPRFPSITLALLARQFGHKQGEGFADPRYLRGIHHNIGYYVHRSEDAAYRLDSDGTRHAYDSERAIIDAHPDVSGLFLSIAHAGHGIMSAPAAGEIAAARLLGQPLTHPSYADFGVGVHWVAGDESVL